MKPAMFFLLMSAVYSAPNASHTTRNVISLIFLAAAVGFILVKAFA